MPITYTREMAWATELLRLLPTIGLIGLYIWFTRRQLGGGFGGGGGMGGRGIFNVGKAQARTFFFMVYTVLPAGKAHAWMDRNTPVGMCILCSCCCPSKLRGPVWNPDVHI